MNTYIVPRVQGTYADILTALGLAKLLSVSDLTGSRPVQLRSDNGRDAFILESAEPDVSAHVGQLYEYIKTEKDKDAPADFYDYDKKKADREKFFKWQAAHKAEAKAGRYPDDTPPPSPNYSLFSSLVDMLKPINSSGYASAYRELASERRAEHFQIALEAFSGGGLPSEIAAAALKKRLKGNKTNEVSIVQIFNPMTGKGMNSPKANTVGMGQEKAPLVLEALKYAGWFVGAVAVTPKGSKDLKVLVVQPTDIKLDTLADVMMAFRAEFVGGGAIQVDILAALTLTETLLKHDDHKTYRRGRPKELISGFQTAYFQNLGSAKGVTNISFIALPHWVNLQDDAGRGEWLGILKEHRQIIRNLDESHSEERNLLEKYRDFLSGQDARAFLEFLSDYGPHVLRLADRGKYALWAQTEHLGRVLNNMGKNDITTIISDAGFQNVAGAIRRATFSALYAKKKHNNRTFEVHYGLAQELKRSAVTKAKFMAALAEFVTEYMTENLRAADRGKKGRAPVTTEDLLAVGKLLDEHDPQMVAMLLIAYGYAKEPKDETPEPVTTPDNPDQDTQNQEENE
ncbi:hypothetical protein ACFSR9_14445 [Deinococcus taklimakanensis]|uniref:Uncharacterized protein n=1 Tax=Deinococcus taklimakanensis TaxID=536443 RepID=A0ABW5P5Z3_9DEIO